MNLFWDDDLGLRARQLSHIMGISVFEIDEMYFAGSIFASTKKTNFLNKGMAGFALTAT